MTEKEKMLSGQLYNANVDQELVAGRLRAKELCYEFNQLHPAEVDAQKALIKKLLGKTKGKFEILAPFWCDYGCNIEIGANFYANHNLVILDCAKVRFGDNVLIGPNCGFYTAGHPVDAKRRNAGLEFARPITVGDNVWIGAGVHVMPGVSIGNNVVIGGGSVVVQDIPDNVVAVGNPCRVVRSVGEEEKRAEEEEKVEK
jgi:maltose O-acetyltransferase